jgi:hypothetical protein
MTHTQLNHTNSRADWSDAVVAAYIHEISARHANGSSAPLTRQSPVFGRRRAWATARRPVSSDGCRELPNRYLSASGGRRFESARS